MSAPIATPTLCCPACGKKLIEAGVVTARVIRLGENDSQARCNRCRRWITVPLVFAPARTLSR